MQPTKCLREEHQLILKVLDCFEIALRRAIEAEAVRREVFEPFIEFFQGFADACHHCKEEDRLFPCLEKAGLPREGGPIGVMLQEHQQARLLVRTMAELLEEADRGEGTARQMIFEHARSYLALLRSHIDKEDHCLFGMADQLVQGSSLTELTVSYRDAESEPDYCRTMTRCRQLADRLMEEYGVTVP